MDCYIDYRSSLSRQLSGAAHHPLVGFQLRCPVFRSFAINQSGKPCGLPSAVSATAIKLLAATYHRQSWPLTRPARAGSGELLCFSFTDSSFDA